MSIPGPLLTGTISYAVLCGVLLVGIFVATASGALSKDNGGIGQVVVSLACFSMWLFWLCAWLHQWHPLIKPIYEE
ncbi:ATP synthase subunit H [Fragilaria crotonensis]|nr:ATP synthase subunit H [Fragilaria crotonensis]